MAVAPNPKHCGAAKRTGGTCARPAGWGTGHLGRGRCKLHGGSTPTHELAAQRAQTLEAVQTLGLPVTVSPDDALEQELHRTAGHVAWLGMVVAEMEAREVVEGFRYTEEGERVPVERLHEWVKLYGAERAHLVRVAKTCVDVGLDERRVAAVERGGDLLASAVRAVVLGLGRRLDDPDVQGVVRAALTTGAGS